jgi:sodium-dependent dicarboxylate transporter 2/3/5
MVVGLPVVLVMLPLAWLVLTRLVYPFRLESGEGDGGTEVARQRQELGPITTPEKRVAVIFALTALAWVARPLLNDLPGLAQLSDTGIALIGALALFLTPSGSTRPGDEGTALLNWDWALRLPWGVLLLFGGGLSLAAAIAETGLAAWIGGAMAGLGTLPLVLLMVAVTAVIILLTELTSNTATAAAFLPVLGALAAGAGHDPLMLAAPAALAASCAFMLPVATPPNAIIFGSGAVTIPQMVRAGVILNVLGVVVITALASVLIPLVFGG